MTAGPLHPDNIPAGRDRSLGKGHGTEALGPSDSSDSGSDLQGIPGSDDLNLDSDSDRNGTGERSAADPEISDSEGKDIGTDRIERLPDEDAFDEDGKPRGNRH